MIAEGKSTRYYERSKLSIPVAVIYRDGAEEWTENTKTEQLTICGAGFFLARPIELRRLIHLRLPMPKKLRLFNFGDIQYDVWGVVRNIRLVDSIDAGKILLKVGAAFTGANAPQSFRQDPKTLYDLKPILLRQSFWDLRELPRKTGRYVRAAEERRAIGQNVRLEAVDEFGRIVEMITAETVNISESGTALIAKMQTNQSRYVLIKDAEKNIRLFAAVRSVVPLESSEYKRLHLEFISGKWSFD